MNLLLELSTDNGSSADNFTGTIFDDEAMTSIISGTVRFSGAHQPEGSLSGFDGRPMAGAWTLWVSDDTGTDLGTLTDWSLVITHL